MRIRPLATLAVVAASAFLLAGCSGSTTPTDTASPSAAVADLCDAQVAAGAAVDAITVTGDVGTPATATFAAPLTVDGIEAKTVVEGDGDVPAAGDYVSIAITAFDASTGALVDSVGYEEGPAAPIPQQISAESGLGQVFGCAPVGSRVVSAFPGSDASPAQVFVLDLLAVTPGDEWCQPQPAPSENFPTVVFSAEGVPTITVPSGVDPSDTVDLQVLKEGDGETVAAGDQVTLNYTGAKWSDGSVFDSSWDRGEPATFGTDQVVTGFGNALIGQAVGSQILVAIPPACGYGASSGNELQTETLVFAIEIISTAPAGQ